MYKLLVGLDRSNVYTPDWLKHIQKRLANCELENVWHDTDAVMHMSSSVQFNKKYKKKLIAYFVNKWVSSMR